MGAVSDVFAGFTLHFDGVILRHSGVKRIASMINEGGKKGKGEGGRVGYCLF